MTLLPDPAESARTRAEMASVYRARVVAERTPCPLCGKQATVRRVEGRNVVETCCDSFQLLIEHLVKLAS